MLKFAANISTLFTELPLRSRFAAARMAGFSAVECRSPYDLSPGEVMAELDVNALGLVLIDAPAGDPEAGGFGLAALPGREAEFERSVTCALDYAEAVGTPLVHVMAGVLPASADPDLAMSVYIANLGRAAVEAAERGITIVIEPLNRRDVPGYFLSRTETARRVIEQVAHERCGLLLDVYHRQMMQGDVARALRENMDIIRHVQIANPPNRCGPDEGEINFDFVFATLREEKYEGWIGCEYTPGGCTRDSFAWFEAQRPLRVRPGLRAATPG